MKNINSSNKKKLYLFRVKIEIMLYPPSKFNVFQLIIKTQTYL